MQYSYRIRSLDGTLLVDGATFVVYSTQKEANDAGYAFARKVYHDQPYRVTIVDVILNY